MRWTFCGVIKVANCRLVSYDRSTAVYNIMEDGGDMDDGGALADSHEWDYILNIPLQCNNL